MDQKSQIDSNDGHDGSETQAGCEREAGAVELPLTIREVAREFAVTLRTLRFYENKRLLAPQRDGAVRLYGRRERERLAFILRGRRLGFTLAEIAALLASRDGDPHSLHLTRTKCIDQIKLLERRKREIEAAVTELRQIYTAFYRQTLERPAASSSAAAASTHGTSRLVR